MTRTYVMSSADGRSEQRDYATRRSADRFATAHGLTVVDSFPAADPPPTGSNVAEWDAYRSRHGYSGDR